VKYSCGHKLMASPRSHTMLAMCEPHWQIKCLKEAIKKVKLAKAYGWKPNSGVPI